MFLLVSTNSDIELSLKLKAAARELKKDASFAGDEATEIGSAISRYPDQERPEHRPQMRTLYRAASASQALALAAEANKLEEFVHAAIAATKIHGDWSVVRKDATDVERGSNPMRRPLWYDQSNPFADECKYIQRSGVVAGGRKNWTFWIDWYQSLLDGRPMLGDEARTWDMLKKIALIPAETWEQGPDVVNPKIAEIWASYRIGSRVELFKATLYDFKFDAMAHVMRAVPMPADWETLTEPDRLQRFLRDALDLREDMIDLSQAFAAEGMVMQGAGMTCTYLAKVLDELENAETVGALRVGKLVEWGRILEAIALREDTKREFGPMSEPFNMAVDKLKDLVRDHFALTLARFSQLRDVRMEKGAAPWEVLKDLRGIVAAVRDGSGGVLPPLVDADAAILDDILDSIDRMIRELDNTTSEDARSSLKREIDFQMAKVGATVGLYGEKAKKAAGLADKGGKSADKILIWEKRGKGLWGLLRAIREVLESLGG
ncbi:hypothetical protein [Roseovarius litorisediminis]|uniref:hypothetical protein n=1 Tax=Roseovarius litorisediminis TaxID=1312363 RepID=UPI00111BF785|nr:hypothetical protein [Roseovarius litorisediminis]